MFASGFPCAASVPLARSKPPSTQLETILDPHHLLCDLVLCPIFSVVSAHYIPLEYQSVTPSRPAIFRYIHSLTHWFIHSTFTRPASSHPTLFFQFFDRTKSTAVLPHSQSDRLRLPRVHVTSAFSKKVKRPSIPVNSRIDIPLS